MLFFGGSFIFGTGVQDSQTLVYRTGINTRDKYQVYNFGFKGYGPHQMLAAIDHGLVKSIVKQPARYAIYLGFYAHIARVNGLASWDKRGPWYALNKKNQVIYKGRFDQMKKKKTNKTRSKKARHQNPKLKFLAKSLIFKKILKREKVYKDKQMDLYAEIINTSRLKIETLYKGCEFHVLYWDDPAYSNQEVLTTLKKKGLRIHLISKMLPGFKKDKSRYVLSPHDHHPNALAHEKIADYIIEKIMAPKTAYK